MVSARCMKCKAQKDMSSPKQTTLKNGRPVMKGECPDCGTKMVRFLPKSSGGSEEKKDDA